jgi:hypothetical protein
VLRGMQMHGTMGRVTVAIWAKDRSEHVFWWRIPIEMTGMAHATGKNFMPIDFEVTR